MIAPLFAFPSLLPAERIVADTTCGPERATASVEVIDVTDLPPGRQGEFIEQELGTVEIVGQLSVRAFTPFGRAWKKAQRKAAEAGCPYVIIVSSGKVLTGGSTVLNPGETFATVVPQRRDHAVALLAKQGKVVLGPRADRASEETRVRRAPKPPGDTPAANIAGKVVERTESAWKFGWVLTVTNPTEETITAVSKVQLVDDEGFPLHYFAVDPLLVSPGAVSTVRGIEDVPPAIAQDVENLAVETRLRGHGTEEEFP